jgi:ribose/xylose/arabinose/galactoside ABC-type transport system permease subunit
MTVLTPPHKIQSTPPHKIHSVGVRLGALVTPWERSALALLAAVIIFFTLTSSFFSGQMLTMSEQFIGTGVIALGLTPVILTGGIDLSVGTTASLSGLVMATLWHGGMNVWLACLVALLVSLLIGLVNGAIIVYGRVQSLVATLATMFILISVATALAGSTPPYGFPTYFTSIGVGTVGPIPIQLIIFALAATIAVVVSTQTAFGRTILMIGLNPDAARYSGIKVNRQLMLAYLVCSFSAGLAGLLIASYYDAARSDLGDSLMMPALTMVVLGGVDIFGGRGRVAGVVIAIFILGWLSQGLLSNGVSPLTATMIGAVVLLVVIAIKGAVSGRLHFGRSR